MEIKVKVEEEYFDLDGNVYVPTGEFRRVEFGEGHVQFGSKTADVWKTRFKSLGAYVVLKPKAFKAKLGEKYWYCGDTKVSYGVQRGCLVDFMRQHVGNYYETETEAEAVFENVKLTYASAVRG